MRRFLLVLIFPLLILSASCTKMRDIRVTDYRIAELENIGFTGVRAGVSLSIDNPARDFTVTSIKGTMEKGGKDLALINMDTPVRVPCGSSEDCLFPLELSLADSVSPFEMLGLVSSFGKADDITVDMAIKIKMSKGGKYTLRFRDVKLSELMSYL